MTPRRDHHHPRRRARRSELGCDDPLLHDRKTVEFGTAATPGNSRRDASTEPYLTAVTVNEPGKHFYETHVVPLLDYAWLEAMQRYGSLCAEMLAATSSDTSVRIGKTGFTKVRALAQLTSSAAPYVVPSPLPLPHTHTHPPHAPPPPPPPPLPFHPSSPLLAPPRAQATVSTNNPSPVHFDATNVGVTVVLAWKVTSDLSGGEHILFDITAGNEPTRAVVFEDDARGLRFMGDYRNVLHSNFGTLRGERFVVSAYCNLKVVQALARRLARRNDRGSGGGEEGCPMGGDESDYDYESDFDADAACQRAIKESKAEAVQREKQRTKEEEEQREEQRAQEAAASASAQSAGTIPRWQPRNPGDKGKGKANP